jgi:RNA polymerase sigma-70 factor, ECF subfamily
MVASHRNLEAKHILQQQMPLFRNKRLMAIPDEDFTSVVREHQAMIYRIAFNFFLRTDVAEEIVQDVFLQCFESLKTIESRPHLKAWLRRAATHRCIDVVRSGKTQKEIQVDELPDVGDSFPDRDPLLSERLRRLLSSLPEQQRMVVILRYGEDMDSHEIGDILAIPASTVRSHLQRALAILREKAPRALGVELYGHVRKESS